MQLLVVQQLQLASSSQNSPIESKSLVFEAFIFSIKTEQKCMNLLGYSLRIEGDWQFVAMVLDRLFLWIFSFACIVGSACIILRAPSLYDDKQPIDVLLSRVTPRLRHLN
ncbi:UNVERIFIED_CONTAM: nAChRalpha1 [Trichonephila clavipes]